MMKFGLTVNEFAYNYIPSNVKVRVVKSTETIFEGTLDELHCSGRGVLNNIVGMVGADEGVVCLTCR